MNVMVWWFVLMIPAWILAAYILWGTDLVVSSEEDAEIQSDERGGE